MRRILLVFLLLSVTLSAQTSAAGKSAGPAGNTQNGKKIFSSYGCYQCHGFEGQGGAGARLAPRPIGFAAFSKYVRQPTGEMPPYTSKVVSEQELADIYAFLQSIPPAQSPNNIPLLKK